MAFFNKARKVLGKCFGCGGKQQDDEGTLLLECEYIPATEDAINTTPKDGDHELSGAFEVVLDKERRGCKLM